MKKRTSAMDKKQFNIKEQYPEIAKMTVQDIINSDGFKEQYEKACSVYKNNNCKGNYYAYKSLEKQGLLQVENFKKEYIACIDKESKLPFAKRVVIYSLGNDTYARTIKKMMKDYDNKKPE